MARCLIDVQLVSQRKLFWYDIEVGTAAIPGAGRSLQASTGAGGGGGGGSAHDDEDGALPAEPDRFMQLDSEAIQHLELVSNNEDGSERGTVLGFLNHCVTPFGKRQLRQWVLFPLNSLKPIRARQAALQNLMALQDQVCSRRGRH